MSSQEIKIYTGSFANTSRYSKRITQIAISRGLPDWYKGLRYKPLAPPIELIKLYRLSDDCDQKDLELYVNTYLADVLSKLDVMQVYRELMRMSAGKPVVLLSQETSNEFSHRNIIRAWFNNSNIRCEELT